MFLWLLCALVDYGLVSLRRQREVVEPILLKAVTTGVLEASINPDNNSVNDIGMGQTLASLELEDDDEINPTVSYSLTT